MSFSSKKGAVVVTESMMVMGGIVVSLILLAILFAVIFGHQSRSIEDTALISIGRNLGATLDRISGSASSIHTNYTFPAGLDLEVDIGFKQVKVVYMNLTKTRAVTIPLTGSINIDKPYKFHDPNVICIIKNRADGKIFITDEECKCNLYDDKCDPACLLEDKCDPACYGPVPDDICDPRCIKQNDGICDPDCYRNKSDMAIDIDCIKSGDGICDPDTNNIEDNVCDADCLSNQTDNVCDPDCGVSEDGICDPDCNPDNECNGVCDPDCAKQGNICDPDCEGDPDCTLCAKEGESCADKPCCTRSLCGEDKPYLTCCPGTKICVDLSKDSCCGNDYCEINPFTDEPSDISWARWNTNTSEPRTWENFYTCSEDCGDFDLQSSCTDNSGCNCESRVNPGTWTASPCITGTQGPQNPGLLVWRDNVIQICSDAAIQYLNRRGWDINQVAADITSPLPRGFGFDQSRYSVVPCTVQEATKTIEGNEKYMSTLSQCCSTNNCPCAICEITKECNGVGFCVDHATAMLTILRTLGVPAENLYAFFMIGAAPSCSRHAVVVYKCDYSLPDNMILDGCINGKWYVFDATWHKIGLLEEYPCGDICSWWNDEGLYNETVEMGQDYPTGLRCALDTWDPSNSVCGPQQGIWCNPQLRR